MILEDFLENDVMTGYSFSVIINGGKALQFSKISNMGAELEYETYCEGGLNSYPHILPKPSSAAGKLSLTRYVHSGDSGLSVFVGMKMSIPLYVSVKNANRTAFKSSKSMGKLSASMEAQDGFSFLFTSCIVTGQRFGDLDAQRSLLMEETIDIAYEKMFYLPGLQVSTSMSLDL